MQSAYVQLGIPGNASTEAVEEAFVRAQAHYTRERLASEEGALRRLADIKAAYQVLRDPAMRAAHDRKLASPPLRMRTVPVEAEPERSPAQKLLAAGLVVLVLIFGTGFYISWRNAETRKALAAQEEAARQVAVADAKRKEEQEQRRAEQQAADQARQDAAERRLAAETRWVISNAQASMRQQEAAAAAARRTALADQQREESNRQRDEQRAAAEARMRVERDKQRVRELCWQQYRRPDC